MMLMLFLILKVKILKFSFKKYNQIKILIYRWSFFYIKFLENEFKSNNTINKFS